MAALKEIVVEGWKVDNGQFRSGYLQKLQDIMHAMLPGCDIQANPHIESKLKLWKKQYNAITDMLNCSGFGWNDTDKMVVVDNADIWEAYCLVS